MTASESQQVISIMRGTWPNMYLRDEGEVVWKFHLEDMDFSEVMRTIRVLSQRMSKPPSVADVWSTLREVKAHKHTCSVCGHSVQSETALSDHMFNVHGVS